MPIYDFVSSNKTGSFICIVLNDSFSRSLNNCDVRSSSLNTFAGALRCDNFLIILSHFPVRSRRSASSSATFLFSATANQVSIFTNRGSRISTMYMTMAGLSAGTASIGTPRLKMVCRAESKWHVVSATTGVTIQGE